MVRYNDGLLHDIDSELDARHESSSGTVLHPCICELWHLQIVGTGLEGRMMGEAGSRASSVSLLRLVVVQDVCRENACSYGDREQVMGNMMRAICVASMTCSCVRRMCRVAVVYVHMHDYILICIASESG